MSDALCKDVGPDGQLCSRKAGHRGIHTDEGVDIGPAAVGEGRAKRIKTWPQKACDHGVPGGCEITCQSCGHTCKRHLYGKCDVAMIDWECACNKYEGTEG